jgi:nucleoside triphosphate pyrophosphatase
MIPLAAGTAFFPAHNRRVSDPIATARREPSAAHAPLVLASASPRRFALLRAAGVAFEVQPADLDETPHPGEPAAETLARLARAKAIAVAQRIAEPHRLVLGADTGVVLGEVLYGKPRDPAHAVQMLGELAGRTHRVITEVAIAETARARVWQCSVTSFVTLREAPREELVRYVAGGEPLDKAGAYAFQGEGRRLVACVEGSESNVIGLPVEESLALLACARAAIA